MKQTGWILLLVAMLANACAPNNVHIEKDWEKFFADHKVEGCFMLFDNGQGSFKVYNIQRAQEKFSPAGTFDIFNSLVALETGVLKDTASTLNGQSLNTAFHVNTDAFFQEAARRITKPVMTKWLDSIKFGNMNISRIDTFWLDNSLLISPDEELGFVKKLYFDNLPFHKLSMQWGRSLMLVEKADKYELDYKVGIATSGRKRIAWMSGWIEENQRPTFFVLNFETENTQLDIPTVRMQMLRGMLSDAGYFKGYK
jgi:beta-lactamase class D